MLAQRKLGHLTTSCLGLGCMGMTGFYGPTDDAESILTIHAALDAGLTLFDTADRYGLGRGEELLGKALEGRQAAIATKFGIVPGKTPGTRALDGSPAYVRSACEASLTRLGRDVIDLYYLHRVDTDVPIEDTVGEMARLVEEGKIRHIGLSEVSAATLRRAHAVHPIAAVQSELSLWHREPEQTILPECERLGTGFVAYWALGIGMLTGHFSDTAELTAGDMRHSAPRFQQAHMSKNALLIEGLRTISESLSATPSQVALAWLLARFPHVVPLFGTKRRVNLRENLASADLSLDEASQRQLNELFAVGSGSGERYTPDGMAWLDR